MFKVRYCKLVADRTGWDRAWGPCLHPRSFIVQVCIKDNLLLVTGGGGGVWPEVGVVCALLERGVLGGGGGGGGGGGDV